MDTQHPAHGDQPELANMLAHKLALRPWPVQFAKSVNSTTIQQNGHLTGVSGQISVRPVTASGHQEVDMKIKMIGNSILIGA
ncbi:MAG: hypothetical protein ACRER5_20265, partial [Pseudomonas sp.]